MPMAMAAQPICKNSIKADAAPACRPNGCRAIVVPSGLTISIPSRNNVSAAQKKKPTTFVHASEWEGRMQVDEVVACWEADEARVRVRQSASGAKPRGKDVACGEGFHDLGAQGEHAAL